jgi:hypothetical protein
MVSCTLVPINEEKDRSICGNSRHECVESSQSHVRPEAGIACHGHDQEFRIGALKVKVSDGLGSVLHHGIKIIFIIIQ